MLYTPFARCTPRMFRAYHRLRIGRSVANIGASFLANVNPTRQFLSPDRNQPSPTSQPRTKPSSRDHSVGRLRTVVFPFPPRSTFDGLNRSVRSFGNFPSPD